MGWREGIYGHLSTHAATQPLVGDRVYPGRLNDIDGEMGDPLPAGGDLPAITYFRIATKRVLTSEGASGYQRVRVQLNCWGRTPDEADALGDAVIAALHGLRGDMGGQTVHLVDAVNDLDAMHNQTQLWRRVIDVQIHHNYLEGAA